MPGGGNKKDKPKDKTKTNETKITEWLTTTRREQRQQARQERREGQAEHMPDTGKTGDTGEKGMSAAGGAPAGTQTSGNPIKPATLPAPKSTPKTLEALFDAVETNNKQMEARLAAIDTKLIKLDTIETNIIQWKVDVDLKVAANLQAIGKQDDQLKEWAKTIEYVETTAKNMASQTESIE